MKKLFSEYSSSKASSGIRDFIIRSYLMMILIPTVLIFALGWVNYRTETEKVDEVIQNLTIQEVDRLRFEFLEKIKAFEQRIVDIEKEKQWSRNFEQAMIQLQNGGTNWVIPSEYKKLSENMQKKRRRFYSWSEIKDWEFSRWMEENKRLQEEILKADNPARVRIRLLKNQIVNSEKWLDPEGVEILFFNLDHAFQKLAISTKRSLDLADRLLAVIHDTDPITLTMLTNTVLMKLSEDLDTDERKNMAKPLEKILGTDMKKLSETFQTFALLENHFRVFLLAAKNSSSRKEFFDSLQKEFLKDTHTDKTRLQGIEVPAGYLVFSLRMEKLYKSFLLSRTNAWQHSLKEESSAQPRNQMTLPILKRNDQTWISAFMRDPDFPFLIHEFQFDSQKIQKDLTKNSLYLLWVAALSLFIGMILLFFVLIPLFLSPLKKLDTCVEECRHTLSPKTLETLSFPFLELEEIRRSFLSRLKILSRQLILGEELHGLSSLLSGKTEQMQKEARRIYKNYFHLDFKSMNDGKIFFTQGMIPNPRSIHPVLAQSHYHREMVYFLQFRQQMTHSSQEDLLREILPFDEILFLDFQFRRIRETASMSLKKTSEFAIARKIQESLIFHPQREGLEIIDRFQPARDLGGDFSFTVHGRDKTRIFIADVSGKGLGAAIYAARVHSALCFCEKICKDPHEILEKVNQVLLRNPVEGMFCTCFILEIRWSENRFCYASAGHNRMFYLNTQKKHRFLNAPGLPLGWLLKNTWKTIEGNLAQNNLFFLYTDGLTEAESVQKNLYGESRVAEILENLFDSELKTLNFAIEKDLQEHTRASFPSDDITWVLLRS